MNTRKTKFFLGALFCLTVFSVSGCAMGENREIRKAVSAELNMLKDAESQTITDSIASRDLLPASLESDAVSQDIADVFALFYDNFSFRVKKITVEEDEAIAHTQIKTISAKALAKDFTVAAMKKHIEENAKHEDNGTLSMNDSYLLLKDLLQTQKYKTEKSTVDIPLEKTADTWQVIHTPELDNMLTGGFLSYVTDPNLLSPSEITEIHFEAIKNFSQEQLKIYLGLDNMLDEENEYDVKIADALAGQISRFFDYKITGETIENGQAVVHASITSTDIHNIVQEYQSNLGSWLGTLDALNLGSDGRYEKIQKLMLSCIEDNETTTTNEVDITLVNDGINWKIQMDSEIAHAVFGDIQDAMESLSVENEKEK